MLVICKLIVYIDQQFEDLLLNHKLRKPPVAQRTGPAVGLAAVVIKRDFPAGVVNDEPVGSERGLRQPHVIFDKEIAPLISIVGIGREKAQDRPEARKDRGDVALAVFQCPAVERQDGLFAERQARLNHISSHGKLFRRIIFPYIANLDEIRH